MRAGPRRRAQRGGFTVVELLVVMAIAAILSTMTVLSFVGMSRRASREGAAEDVRTILRQARLSAVDTGRGAVVRVSSTERALFGLSTKVVAAWHFESADTDTPGAKGMDGDITDGTVTPASGGAAGLCLRFDGGYVDCQTYPIYDQTEGLRAEAYIYPEADLGGNIQTVMAKAAGSAGYRLWVERVDSDGAGLYRLHGWLGTEGGAISMDSGSQTFAGHAWSHVALEYDGFEARLLRNGVRVDESDAGGGRVHRAATTALQIGANAGAERFRGRIDEPRLISVAGGRRVHLPERVAMFASSEAVHFDPQGQLDIAHHPGPVYVALGDPYQAAQLAADLDWDDASSFTVTPRSPFPPAGGLLLVGDEVIAYASATGNSLDIVAGVPADPNGGRAECGTAAADHSAGDTVYFARVVSVSPMGVVGRVR